MILLTYILRIHGHKKLPKQLPNIPVSKAALTKNAQGYYLSFPDQKSCDMAANNLKSAFAVESKDNSPKLLLPKIKISGLEIDSYAKNSNGLLQLNKLF